MCCWQLVGPLPSWWPCWAEPCWCWLERRFPTDVMRLGKTSKTTCLLGICCKKEVAKKSKHIFFKPTHFAMFPQKDQFFFFSREGCGGEVFGLSFFLDFGISMDPMGSNPGQSYPRQSTAGFRCGMVEISWWRSRFAFVPWLEITQNLRMLSSYMAGAVGFL